MRNRGPIYVFSIWHWNASERCYERTSPIHVSGASLVKARERAAQSLAVVCPIVEGTHWTMDREMRHAPRAVIETRYRTRTRSGRIFESIKGRHEIVSPESRYVPSVGERGWTP